VPAVFEPSAFEYHELMFKTFRLMMDAADPSVVDILGYMADQYTFARKKADSYFRSVGRLLCDLEAGDLEDLRKLVSGVDSCESILGEVGEVDVFIDYPEGKPSLVKVDLRGGRENTIGHLPSAERLFLLMKREGFGSNIHGGMGTVDRTLASGDETMVILFDTARQLCATVDPTLRK
jgi:hypothetical protein